MTSGPNTVPPVQDLLSHLSNVTVLCRPCLQFVIYPLSQRINGRVAYMKTSLKTKLAALQLCLVIHSVTLSEPLP